MPANCDKPQLWDADIGASVDLYNSWFKTFAPQAYKDVRETTEDRVKAVFAATGNLININPTAIRAHLAMLPILRMSCSPPLARDRLTGLSGAKDSVVDGLDTEARLPVRLSTEDTNAELLKICQTIETMLDPSLVVWKGRATPPTALEIDRAALVVADRLCGAEADPIIRNAQEERQLKKLQTWLEARGYTFVPIGSGTTIHTLQPGQFGFRINVSITGGPRVTRIPIDAVVMPLTAASGTLPLLIEAKSAGDFTNTNKRQKEEAQKMHQLREQHPNVNFILFLCGYFGKTYLSYEAADHFDWVWEHRIDDLAQFGL